VPATVTVVALAPAILMAFVMRLDGIGEATTGSQGGREGRGHVAGTIAVRPMRAGSALRLRAAFTAPAAP
jgi:hypothetical protein